MDNTHTLQNFFMFGLFAVLFILLACMMYPFWSVLLWTVLLYILIRPLYQKCTRRLDPSKKTYGLKRCLWAGTFAVGTLILIIVPLVVISILLAKQLISFLNTAEIFLNTHPDLLSSTSLSDHIAEFTQKTGIALPNIDVTNVRGSIMSFLHSYSSRLFSIGKSLISKTGSFIISLVFIVFALYFCFLDGSYLATLFKKAIPIKPTYMKVLMKKFADTTSSLFAGYILVALYQALAALIIMLIFHVDGALLFSVLLLFSTFIPLFGASLVWAPVGILVCMTQSLLRGIVFLIANAVCVSMLDNFLRPFFLKDRIHVHPLVIFFAILGGIKVFGMNGLILGPTIVIMFFTVLDLLVNTKEEKNADRQASPSSDGQNGDPSDDPVSAEP